MFDEPQKKKEEKWREERKGERGGSNRVLYKTLLSAGAAPSRDYYN